MSADAPVVSVIMPAYNAERYIATAIESVVQQTFGDWELIVVDDGSTDDTAAVVHRFADPRIRYIYQENAERAVARNRGLAQARGTYIAFLDADDWLLPHKLACQVAALEQQPEPGVVCSGHHCVDGQGNLLSTSTPWPFFPRLDLATWLIVCPVVINANLFYKKWLEQIDGFDSTMRNAEDYDLCLRLAYAGCPMIWVEEVVCVYRLHGENTVYQIERQGQGHRRAIEKVLAQPDLPAEIQALRPKVERQLHLEEALRAYAVGDTQVGAGHLAAFMGTEPWTPESLRTLAATIGDRCCNPLWGTAPLVLVNTIWSHLPPAAFALQPWHSWARANAARTRFYQSSQRVDRPAMLAALWQIVWNRARLVDRGLLLTLVKSLFRCSRPHIT